MKYLLSIILILLSLNFNAQSSNTLDEKNGFKDLKLGSKYSDLSNDLIFRDTSEKGEKNYWYKGECCQMVFDYPVDKIAVSYFDNVLISITIFTKLFQQPYNISGKYTKFRTDDFMAINSSFEQLFGVPDHREAGNGEVHYLWIGKKVILTSSYDSGTVSSGDRQIINVTDKNFFDSQAKNGF